MGIQHHREILSLVRVDFLIDDLSKRLKYSVGLSFPFVCFDLPFLFTLL